MLGDEACLLLRVLSLDSKPPFGEEKGVSHLLVSQGPSFARPLTWGCWWCVRRLRSGQGGLGTWAVASCWLSPGDLVGARKRGLGMMVGQPQGCDGGHSHGPWGQVSRCSWVGRS